MTAVVGLDLSLTGSGLARITWGLGTVVTETWRRGEKGVTVMPDPVDRCRALHRLKTDIVDWVWPASLVVVESLVPNPKSRSTDERAALWYLVVTALAFRNVRVVEVNPTALKRYATGRGRADKDAMEAAAEEAFPGTPLPSDDEVDALWLAAVGMHLSGGPLPYPVTDERADVLTGIPTAKEAA